MCDRDIGNLRRVLAAAILSHVHPPSRAAHGRRAQTTASVSALTDPPPPLRSAPTQEPRLSETIGRYRIIGTLGEGGMGTVYEAEQDQPQRLVALKVIRPDYVSPELIRRFERESQVLGRLQHPGIAQIYEAGTADGPYGPQSFFAMELVRGQSLTEFASGRALDVKQRLQLFARICDAVHYAHQQGVIHRDLKPANIMVDATGQPKILDFGVARLTDADVQATRQTSVGEVVGTLQYMSPEQINADPLDIDTRSDVYSLGVILYELLTGKLPYDLARKLIYEAARVILIVDPAPLSSVDRKFRGDVEVIVGKALEKEKTRRYASADEMASDVRRFLSDEPIAARPASAIYQMRKFARRNRAMVGGLAIAALILVAGTAVSLWQAVRATAAERLAESRRSEAVASSLLAERRRAQADSALQAAEAARAEAQQERAAATASAGRATSEAAKATAVNGFLQNMLASSDPANARGQELSVREVLDQAALTARTGDLNRQPQVRAAVQGTIGRTYYALGLYDQARPLLDSVYEIRRRISGSASLELAESVRDRGQLASAQGNFAVAEAQLRQGLMIRRAKLRADDDLVTKDMTDLAHALYSQGKFAEAEQVYRQALGLARSRHGNTGAVVAERLQSLGTFLSYTSRLQEAQPLLAEAVEVLRATHGSDHPSVVNALVALSDVQTGERQFAAATASLRDALPIARKLYGDEHPVLANVYSRLGSVLISVGKQEEAEPLIRDALAMRLKLLGDQHPDVQLARVDLARLQQAKGRFADADTLLKQALAARRKVLGEASPAVSATLGDLGYLEMLREDYPASARYYRESLPIWRAAGIEDEEVGALGQIGWALQKQGKFDEAEPILRDVVARRRARFGDKHFTVGDAMEKLAAVVFGRGNPALAESLSVAGLDIRRTVYGPRTPQVAGQLQNVSFFREAQGDTSGATPWVRESYDIYRALRPPQDPAVLNAQRLLAIDLCATEALAEGDSLIRAAIAQSPLDSAQVLPYRLRGAWGFCLTRQRRFAEAEAPLLLAESGLRALLPGAARHRATVVTWLVHLYEQWGKPEQAAEWKGRQR